MLLVQKQLIEAIKNGLSSLFEIQANDLVLQETKKEFEGSYTFVVFPFTKQAGLAPAAIAEKLGQFVLENYSGVKKFQVVQGFLNFSLTDEVWINALNKTIEGSKKLSLDKKGEKVLIEYSSPNTNKPLHLGHLRNNFLGFSVAQILDAAGYEVIKTNLVNDRGIHICKSMLAYQLMGQGETPESSGLKGDHLVGKYYVAFDQLYKSEIDVLIKQGLDPEKAKKEAPILLKAQDMLLAWENGDQEVMDLWKTMNTWVFAGFEKSYAQMGVHFDKIYRESNTYLLGKKLVDEGLKEGVFYQKDDQSVWINLEDEGLDEKLVLRKDGTSVYITQDMGTAQLKFEDFGAKKSIYVVGNEQDYHFEVLFHILKKLNKPYSHGNFHLSYGMVDLPSGKMKSREGTVVDADDLMAEMVQTAKERTMELGKTDGFTEDASNELYQQLGMGALKYFLLKVDPKKRMMFNPVESIDFQGNTGPFIQYGYVRTQALLRKANWSNDSKNWNNDSVAMGPEERALIQLLYAYPDYLAEAVKKYDPSVMAAFAYEVCKAFNVFYQHCNILREENQDVRTFRLLLTDLAGRCMSSSMSLLGIQMPDKM